MGEQDEEVGRELEIISTTNDAFPLINLPDSNYWETLEEPGMLYIAPSSVPASPIENLTLWNHHESGQAEPFDAHLPEYDLLVYDWPFESKFRQRIANIIVLASRKHRLPISGQEELRKFALGLEENIFAAVRSKSIYNPRIYWRLLAIPRVSVCEDTVQEIDEYSKVQNAKSPLHNLQSGELGNIQEMDKKLRKKRGRAESISLDDLQQLYGKRRKEAAESLNVSVSTFKVICRENGIPRWPSKKRNRDRDLLSNRSSSETVPVADGPRISISTALIYQQKSWSSNLSVDKEIGTSLNDHVLRNGDEENTMIQEGDSANREVLYKPQELEPACDGTSHLEKQYLGRERLSCNTVKDVIVSVEGSSSYDFRNVSEPNQGHLAVFASFCEVDKDQLISTDDLESNCIKSQSTLESISEPSLQNDARRMKLNFNKLITLPLEDITNPNHEASMKEALTILADNLSLFRDEQAKQLLEFQFDFPNITNCWRDCSQSIIDCQNFLAEFENTKSLLETSTKEEDDLKDKYTQLENKKKEMMAQLEAIQKEENEITKRRSENFNQTKHLAALAEEQGGRTKDKELQMTIASNKLDNLKRQWVSVQSSFN